MNEQPSADSSASWGSEPWCWVPVRLDLSADVFPEDSVPYVDSFGEEADRVLGLLRDYDVPALYTAGDDDLQLMLPVHVEQDSTRVAHADAEGHLTLGPELDALLEAILEDPELEEATWTRDEGPSHPVTAVAILRGRLQDVPRWMKKAGANGWFDAASASDSPWVVVASEDYDSLLQVVDACGCQAVVLDTDGSRRAMTFLDAQAEPLVLSWGPVRETVTSYPPNSPAGILQTGGAAAGSDESSELVRVTAVAELGQRFGLDQATGRRLSQYSRDSLGKYGPESVLQLLGYPDLPAKILDGRKVLRTEENYRRFLGEDSEDLGLARPRPTAQQVGEGLRRALGRHGLTVAAVAGAGLSAWALRHRR